MEKCIFKRSALNLAICSIMMQSAVKAEEIDTEEINTLPTVDVTGQNESYKVDSAFSHKYSQPLSKTPKTLTVIPEEVMQDRGMTNLQDSLRGVSGISMAAGEGGTPPGDSMNIRGFSARTDIFIDGIRDISGYSRDTYNTEAIEVAKGPGSVVSGRGSTGGSVNLVTKEPRLDRFVGFQGQGGIESDHYRFTLDANTFWGDTALRLNALGTDGGVAGRNEVENGMKAVALAFGTGLETGRRFNLKAEYQDQDRIPDYGLPWIYNYPLRYPDRKLAPQLAKHAGGPAPVSYDNFYGNIHRDFEDIDAVVTNMSYEHDLSQNSMLQIRARYGSVKRKSIVTAPRIKYRVVDDVRIYGLDDISLSSVKARDLKTTMFAVQTAFIANFGRHDVSVGAEYTREREKSYSLSDGETDNLKQQANNLQVPNPFRAYSGSYSRTGESTKGQGTSYALYGFDSWRVLDTVTLHGGLRYEYYDSKTNTSTAIVDRDDKMLSFSAGIVYDLSANGMVYFAAGNSFNPAAEDLTASTWNKEAKLDPEKSFSYEVGAKWELFGDRLALNLALFRTDKTDARSDDPVDGKYVEILGGEQRVQGIELSGFGRITPQFDIAASYTFQDSEVLKATGADIVQVGKELRRVPEHSLSVWGSYKPTPKWKTGLGVQYMSERYNSSDPWRSRAPEYYRLDAMAAYQLMKAINLQLNLDNITDKRYIDQVGGGHFIPGPARNFRLSFIYDF